MKELATHLKNLAENQNRILILSHPHADPDALGSIIGLGQILERLGADVVRGVPEDLDKLAGEVIGLVEHEVIIDPPLDVDAIVVVDTSSFGQLNEYGDKILDLDFVDVIFIDHHRPDEKMRDKLDFYYVDESASSTVELILRLVNELDFEFDSEVSTLMLTGIITDTGHFKFANQNTFEAVSELIESGADYRKALDTLEVEDSHSERGAVLKAAQRSEIHRAHGRWIVFSEVGAYESSAASFFINAGADVSLVASQSDGEVRMSTRSRSGLSSETNLHLGKLMSTVADHFGGTGGGHGGAAGMSAEAELEDVKERTLEELKKMLKPKED